MPQITIAGSIEFTYTAANGVTHRESVIVDRVFYGTSKDYLRPRGLRPRPLGSLPQFLLYAYSEISGKDVVLELSKISDVIGAFVAYDHNEVP